MRRHTFIPCVRPSSVGDNSIDLAILGYRGLDSRLDLFDIGDVGGDCEDRRLGGFFADGDLEGFEGGMVAGREDEGRAGTRVGQCDLSTDAARCAGDEDDFTLVGLCVVKWFGVDPWVDAAGDQGEREQRRDKI